MADLRQASVAKTAKIMLAFEAMAKHEPEKVTPDVARELERWHSGIREQLLSELPSEVRRRLEEEASRLAKRRRHR